MTAIATTQRWFIWAILRVTEAAIQMFRRTLQVRSRSIVLALAFLFVAARACAAPAQFGPFIVDPEIPNTIILNGEIRVNSALDFRRALSANPNAVVISLNSPGGLIQIALLIADEVHQRGMRTIIPVGAGCYSSCVFIFFAGKGR